MTLCFDDLVMSPNVEVDAELIEYWKNWIDQASHFEMCVADRYAPGGHILFRSDTGLNFLFDKKFDKFNRMTTDMSKRIGFFPITDTKFNTITEEQFKEIMARENF